MFSLLVSIIWEFEEKLLLSFNRMWIYSIISSYIISYYFRAVFLCLLSVLQLYFKVAINHLRENWPRNRKAIYMCTEYLASKVNYGTNLKSHYMIMMCIAIYEGFCMWYVTLRHINNPINYYCRTECFRTYNIYMHWKSVFLYEST